MTTKTTEWVDTDNEGTDDNNNGVQGTKTDKEDNHHRTTTGMGTGMDNDTTRQKRQRCTRRRTTRMGQEWKAQAMDPAPYDEEHKTGPKRRRRLLGHR
jgi:hypothetical protein